ncbi:MAG: SDR family NAD(P)-dependent oxidoreductase [Chloroflexota bacterium]
MFDPKAVAIVGVGAILPDAEDAPTFWNNIKQGRYSVTEVPPDRWRVDLYYDPDPKAPDKTYTKIGAWVRSFPFEPLKWGIPIPPNVLAVMDDSQKWGISVARQALLDYGYPQKLLDGTRTAVIIGNALAGENHYITSLRIRLPDYMEALKEVEAFAKLPPEIQKALLEGMQQNIRKRVSNITEDTMPGELGNIIAGRIANVFNFSGPNFITDAACASSHAAVQAAIDGLINHQFDAVLTGGVDRNMGVEGFVKFCKIGALSPDGSRPFAEGANGFVMGEGAVLFLLKRLVDAERDGDKIYAVIRGIGASSDGKGKGITAPNPVGQQRAIERAWKNAGVNPASVGLIEAHGTSTRVGDVVETQSLNEIFGKFGLPPRSIAMGSVKSNIGHLKSAAGAAGLLKAMYALYEKVLPPSVNFHKPNPNIDFDHLPFYVNTETRPWENAPGEIRRAGVSSFGFGGTNFHMVLEEWVPGLLTSESKVFAMPEVKSAAAERVAEPAAETADALPQPYRGLLFMSGENVNQLKEQLTEALEQVRKGQLPPSRLPDAAAVAKPERLVIDYTTAEELLNRGEKALKTLENETPNAWQALTAQGVYRGSGQAGKVAFMFPGQGSQYVNMLKDLCEAEPLVAETFKEADDIMTPILGKPLTSYIYVDGDEESLKQAEAALRDTAITQPAMLTANVALLRLMEKFGFRPDFVIGHSLGEYAALVASGVLTFAEALEVVSARGREMKKVSVADNGGMVAVSAPIQEVERILKGISEYVVIANINSPLQSVVGGSTAGIQAALEAFEKAGYQATRIPVSHAFHTEIVAPASEPLKRVIARMNLQAPKIPVAANVTGQFYPTGREEILDILGRQVASPVQFIKGMETLYSAGARVFVEIGPKRVLNALANDIFKDRSGVMLLATNHPRKGAVVSFNEAVCGLLAAGIAPGREVEKQASVSVPAIESAPLQPQAAPDRPIAVTQPLNSTIPAITDGRLPLTGSVVISGAGLGLPGKTKAVFQDDNILSILKGEIRIEPLPEDLRQRMVEKRPTRLEKSEAGAQMIPINSVEMTVKLGGQRGQFDPVEEFGVPADRMDVCDITTQLAIAAGIEALRDAGIPLVMAYRKTSKGTYLPDRWRLPEALADETGVIFASAFPGLNEMAEEMSRYSEYKQVEKQLEEVRNILALAPVDQNGVRALLRERIKALETRLNEMDYHFDRRFVFRVLAMGHSQFAEYIGARGPNTYVNAACATTTHAIAVAEDWIRAGRCRRVIIIAGDDVTSGPLAEWIGTALFTSGAATTEGNLRLAALPFDRRRNGMIMGMGAAALVVEAEDAVRERGMRGICEILATDIANSAYHGTRLDVPHVREIMNRLISTAERRFGIRREEIAAQTMFMSHETYTPARGGSASAEIQALRYTFGDKANRVIIANTKGFTGHAMGVGIEDVVAVKALEYGMVPPIANYDENFQPDPDLGDLNLSRGGEYPVRYALRLGAGFGSQIAMALFRVVAGVKERINQPVYQQWLADIAGYEKAELEVEKRTLRIRHAGPPVKPPAISRWEYGQGPTRWAEEPDAMPQPQPAGLPSTQPEREVVQHTPQPEVAKAAEPSTAAITGTDTEQIKEFVLNLVSEKTGYPVEMLDLDLDLEADLGIDTVKQAEIFAAIRTHYNIPRREDLRLVDYNTLNKVIAFMAENAAAPVAPEKPEQSPASSGEPAPQSQPLTNEAVADKASSSAGVDREAIQAYVLSVVSEKTGYPVEMLDLGLDLEADLGIDTVKQAELFAAIRTHYNIPRREDLRLVDYNTLEKVINFMVEALGGGAISQPAVGSPMTVSPAIELQHPPQPKAEAEKIVSATTAQPGSVNEEEIKTYVLSVVSEKTGYPVEMLDLDLDLEADLGIDTVKQAELFATIRTHYNIPRREDLRLVDYNTLKKVIAFMVEALSTQTGEKAAEKEQPISTEISANASPSPVVVESSSIETPVSVETANESKGESEEATLVIRRRIPKPVLLPKLDLCLPSGVVLEENSRVIMVGDEGKVSDSLSRRLRSRKVQTLNLTINQSLEEWKEKIAAFQKEGKVDGIYFLAGLNRVPGLDEMSHTDFADVAEKQLMRLYHLLREVEGEPFLICATRMGGLHGYGAEGAQNPSAGFITGFTKALSRERPNTLVKVLDFEAGANESQIAAHVLQETLFDASVVEIGWEGGQRFTISLFEEEDESPEQALPEKPVVLISGGTGGIVAPILTDLARRTAGVFYLLGRSPLADPDDPLLQRVKSDRDGLKKDLLREMSAAGQKPSPAQIEEKLAALERMVGILDAIQTAQKFGATIHYRQCDVADPEQVQGAVHEMIEKEGRVDVLIHAAGVERSRKLHLKTEEEFRTTIEVKAAGFFNLYKALQVSAALPHKVLLFGSVAGRFGNSGQTDYSAANDWMAKAASHLRSLHPQMRIVTMDWSAWAQVGMASRGYIPQLMEMGGIDLMPPQQAAGYVYRELVRQDAVSEVVISGSLGVLEKPFRKEGGLDIEAANRSLREGRPTHVMLSKVTGFDPLSGVLLEAELNPDEQPFLKDHALNGIPLLPGVMGIEGFSAAAKHVASVLGSEKAGFEVDRLEDIQFLAPFKFYRNEPRRVTWKAQVVREHGGLIAYVRLESMLAAKTRPNEIIQHFAGKVHLSPKAGEEETPVVQPPRWNGAYTVGGDEIYRLYFHGPSFQVLEGVQRDGGKVLGKLRQSLPAITEQPSSLVTMPILLEAILQTAGIWEAGATGTLALPRSIGELVLHPARPKAEKPLFAEVTPARSSDGTLMFNARLVDQDGRVYLEVKDYRTSALPYSVDAGLLKPMRLLVNGSDAAI